MPNESTRRTPAAEGNARAQPRRAGIAALLLLTLAAAACGNEAPPASAVTLESLAVGTGQAYAAVGVPQQLTVTGHYSDGTAAALTSGVTWASSDTSVATVDPSSGIVTPWSQGTAQISARHGPSGLSATASLTARLIVPVAAGAVVQSQVDTTAAFFHVSGLTPGGMYSPTLSHMTDDVDLAVYADPSMSQESRLCVSESVGIVTETCLAPASSSGEIWVYVDGEWTRDGARFELEVPAAQPAQLAGTLAYPAQLPYSGSVGVGDLVYEVTGLTPGARYEIRIANLTADIDLAVYGDPYEYGLLCESYASGTVDDSCTATADPEGVFFVEVDGETTRSGGSYTLSITAR